MLVSLLLAALKHKTTINFEEKKRKNGKNGNREQINNKTVSEWVSECVAVVGGKRWGEVRWMEVVRK